MLSAQRKSDGKIVFANSESKAGRPFNCLECGREVSLRTGSVRVSYFAHTTRSRCEFSAGESNIHRRCKLEIYQALLREPNVTDIALEKSFGNSRPDVFARIDGVPVAFEVQISVLSIKTIIRRTEEYARKGIYVLWLPQWTPYLDGVRYSPRLWEKWIHGAYFGRVYFWTRGLNVVSYRFEPHFKSMRQSLWYRPESGAMAESSYSRKSKRYRTPVRDRSLNLVKDFAPQKRPSWNTGKFFIPEATIFNQKET